MTAALQSMRRAALQCRGWPLTAGFVLAAMRLPIPAPGWAHVGGAALCMAAEILLAFILLTPAAWLQRIRCSRYLLPIVFWPLAGLLPVLCFQTSAFADWSREWVQLIIVIGILPLIVSGLIADTRIRQRLYRGMWLGFLITTIVGIWQYTALQPGPQLLKEAVAVKGLLTGRMLYGAYCALMIPLLLDNLLNRTASWWRHCAMVYLGIAMLSILHAGLLAAAFIGALIVLLKHGMAARIGLILMIIWVLARSAAGISGCVRHEDWSLENFAWSSISKETLGFSHSMILADSVSLYEDADLDEHARERAAGIQAITDAPLTGTGLGSYQHTVNSYKTYFENETGGGLIEPEGYPLWLVITVEGGLPGLIFFLAAVVQLLIHGRFSCGRRAALGVLFLVGLCAMPLVRGPELIIAYLLSHSADKE